LGEDGCEHTIHVAEHFIVPKTHDGETFGAKVSGSSLIGHVLGMLTAIQLDD
jgi:hypothetical protein